MKVARPDKILFPEAKLTKADLAQHYVEVWPAIAPHVLGRAVTVVRAPDGIGAQAFVMQRRPDHAPPEVGEAVLEHATGAKAHMVIQSVDSLIWLADQAAVEIHRHLARADRPDRPDRLILDLDPSGATTFEDVQAVAREARAALERRGLNPFVMTTGRRGLHVVAPIEDVPSFEASREVARRAAREVEGACPERATLAHRKADRGDRVYLDVLRNGAGATAIAPYSTRAQPEAPVAVPLAWDEALARGLDPAGYGPEAVHRRLRQKRCPWADMVTCAAAPR
jgi:bifunctional non-homologous end joining protein LigD